MASIRLLNVNKIYSNNVRAVVDFNLEIKDQEFVVFVGPSGCGKSTTLRMIAGLEDISSGEIYIDDVLVNNVEPKNRGIAMVFQNYALYPHMSVRDNMAFSLKIAGVSKQEINEKILNAASILGLNDYLDKKPSELSGGQRQRVALGRAIVRSPKVFLMDEPLSNLDAKLRTAMRSELLNIHKTVKATTIYVTHDQIEAMTMADKIVVMKDGFIQQIGTPKEIYFNPKNLFVATFIGTPAMNIVPVQISKQGYDFCGARFLDSDYVYQKLEDFYLSYEKSLLQDIEELESLIAHRPTQKKNLFKKHKGQENNPLSYENQLKDNKDKLEQVRLALSSDTREVMFGFRPSDVYLAGENSNINPSSSFSMEIVSTEMFGHDLSIHARHSDTNLLINKPVKGLDLENHHLDLVLDLDAVFYFDKISGERIL